jgi:hypothetical protein
MALYSRLAWQLLSRPLASFSVQFYIHPAGPPIHSAAIGSVLIHIKRWFAHALL